MTCWARYLFLGVVVVLGSGHLLAACGQKGPLYMQDESAVVPGPSPEPVTVDDTGTNAETEAVEDLGEADDPLL